MEKLSSKTLQALGLVCAQPIEKGWSSDRKYRVKTAEGEDFLLRITPKEKEDGCTALNRLMQRVAELDVSVSRTAAFGTCDEGIYSLQTWVNGEDAGDVLPMLPDIEQYMHGLTAGRILRKLHTLPAPEDIPDWATRFNQKIDRKIAMCRACPIRFEGAEKMIAYVNENRHLLDNRPQSFQHGDYHIGNMMLEDGRLVVIDFDRFDYGDPWEEFNRITWCAQKSPFMATGLINGYFENEEIPEAFWRLLALYIYNNLLSSVAWAIPYGQTEIDTMLQQIKEVREWYDDTERIIPTWYAGQVYVQETDGVPYRLKKPFDFGFLKKYGTVFKVYDDQDSGNICFGVRDGEKKYFVKFAGAPTYRSEITAKEAVENLKRPMHLYTELAHENLIRLIEAGEMGGGYAAVFEWTDAISMGRMYPLQHKAFMELPVKTRLQIFEDVLRFHIFAAEKGYAAVDLYDSTLMYDREQGRTFLCDIDFYRKAPFVNEMGRMWGSSLFMSPEEFERGAVISETTNVYTLGAMAFALFANYRREAEAWTLTPELFAVAQKATRNERDERYGTLTELLEAWTAAQSSL